MLLDLVRGSSFCLIQAAMQPLVTLAVKRSLLPPKKDQILRRAYSDAAAEAAGNKNVETRRAECECCGMKEEYTPAYIAGVQELFCGSWVCGLCAEAVKENMKRLPPSPASAELRRALDSHMEFCKKFNGTTRLNPKLSFAGAMREIARKSSLHRSSGGRGGGGIARTRSCGPFMDVKFDSNV